MPQEDVPPKRVLRPCTVLDAQNDVVRIQLQEPAPGVEESFDAFVHFEDKRKFVQQSARVLQIDGADRSVMSVQLRGTPVSAEGRQAFRVSCLSANLRATIDDEQGCEVVDLSITGIGFYGQKDYAVGRRVVISLTYDGKAYRGHGTIMGSRRMTARTVRYGVHCADIGADTLARSLNSISLAVQAEQLRRLAKKE